MKREELNLEPFYYVEPMRIIDDPDESLEFIFKYDKEKTEIENFLKDCNLNDFIWVIITTFREKYASGSLLGAQISDTIQEEKSMNGTLYSDKFNHRKDLDNPKYKFNKDDHFEYLEFEIVPPFMAINNAVEEALNGKSYSKNGNQYILNSDSGIEYIEATPTFFKLKANMNKSKRFH